MMTTQNETLPTERKPLDLRRFLDDWVMLLAAIGIFVACTLLIDNFLSPLNMRGWAWRFPPPASPHAPCFIAWRPGTSTSRSAQ